MEKPKYASDLDKLVDCSCDDENCGTMMTGCQDCGVAGLFVKYFKRDRTVVLFCLGCNGNVLEIKVSNEHFRQVD